MIVNVSLNGTNKNPYQSMGFKCNPFPAIPKAGYGRANEILADLGSKPIRDVEDLKRRLAGCAPKFVQLCCEQFKPGQMVRFNIEFNE